MLGAFIIDIRDFGKHKRILIDVGIEDVFLSFSTSNTDITEARREFNVYREFKLFAKQGTEHFVENCCGEKKNLLALGCPSNQELWRINLKALEKKLSRTQVDRVVLDFVRFPSFADGDFFYSCFCKECENFARSLSYDLEDLRKSVKEFREYFKDGEIKFSFLSSWLELKEDIITSYVETFSETILYEHRAFLFPLSLSQFVG
jgi:hypothetical protein